MSRQARPVLFHVGNLNKQLTATLQPADTATEMGFILIGASRKESTLSTLTKSAYALLALLVCAELGRAASLSGTVKANASGASIVYLEPASASPRVENASERQYVMSQRHMKFTPQILAVPVGATVVFKNEDAPAHNVFWPSIDGDKKLGHNLGTFLGGQERVYKFDRPGIIPLLCNVHPEMEGYIIVSATPYYAQAMDLLGLYQINNVPDGQYKVTAWHAGKKPETKTVSLSGDVKLDFDLSH